VKIIAYTYHIQNQHANLHKIGYFHIHNSTIGRLSYFRFVSDFASFFYLARRTFWGYRYHSWAYSSKLSTSQN